MSHTASTPAGSGAAVSWATSGSVRANRMKNFNVFIGPFISLRADLHPFRSATGFDSVHERFQPIAIPCANWRAAHVAGQFLEAASGHPPFDRHDHSHELRWDSQAFVTGPPGVVGDFPEPEKGVLFQTFCMPLEHGVL